MSRVALRLEHIGKSYREGAGKLVVLGDVSCAIRRGEIVALVGPSGSGKSTLLQIAGLLDRADSGQIWIGGTDCATMSDADRTRARRDHLGFVYQFHHLLPEFSALENVSLPLRIAGRRRAAARRDALTLLERFGLGSRTGHRPGDLSGGERQRVAIARAIVHAPRVLLADEPTGNLDHRTAEAVFEPLLELARRNGLGALIATHNTALAERMDRRLYLHNGTLSEA